MIAAKEKPVIKEALNSGTEDLIDAMRKTEREITDAHGAFNLFGLFERESIPDRWDLVASAPWLPVGREGIQIIADYVARLPKAEAIQIARIVPMAPESAPVRSIVETISIVSEGFVPVGPLFVGSAEVLRGYILVSQKESHLPVNEEAQYENSTLIEEGRASQLYGAIAEGNFWGMQTMNQCLIKYVRAGLISEEEALANAGNVTEMKQMLRRL